MIDTQTAKPVLIFVDDDPMLLASTRRRMRKVSGDWNVCYASSGAEALEIVQQTPPDVVVSDMRMPEMDGAQLLGHIRSQFPHAVRIILSGQSEQEQLADARKNSHLFLSKPCDIEILQRVVQRCIEIRQQLDQTSVESLIRADTFAEAPESVRQALAILRDVNCKATTLRQRVESDDVIRDGLISVLDESNFQNIEDAFSNMPLTDLKSLFCIATLLNELPQNEHVTGIRKKTISHSVKVAKLAADLAEQQQALPDVRNDAFLAGLLHGYGKLVMAAAAGKDYIRCLGDDVLSSKELAAIETETFGCTHAEAATYLLMKWGFDPRVLESVIFRDDEINEMAPLYVSAIVAMAVSKVDREN